MPAACGDPESPGKRTLRSCRIPPRSFACTLAHRSFALHVSTMTLPGTAVNAGQKGNDANQIRDQQVVGSLDTRIGKVNAPRSSQPFPHHLRDLEHDVESRSVGTRADLALDCADAVV